MIIEGNQKELDAMEQFHKGNRQEGLRLQEECLICSAPLEYLEKDELMECAVCHKKELSKARCIHDHYVCNECHTAGMDAIVGFWGACGAGISTGMFVSIISESTPLTEEPFGLSHRMTAMSLGEIGQIGGPQCCKRDSYLSILSAINFAAESFNVRMEKPEIICRHFAQNNQCIGKRCPFAKANH